MILLSTALLGFFVSLVVSAAIIYVVTKVMGEEEGFGTALFAAFIGAVIYGVSYYFLGSGTWASVLSGIAWLIALGSLYGIGWIKAFFIAVFVWLLAGLISYFLPTAIGSL